MTWRPSRTVAIFAWMALKGPNKRGQAPRNYLRIDGLTGVVLGASPLLLGVLIVCFGLHSGMARGQTPAQDDAPAIRAEAEETLAPQSVGPIALAPPGDREFVLDKANLISDADEQKIKQLADQLLTEKAAPIIVVTIESMAQYGGGGLRIETFARLLFDQWGIGPAKLGETQWNYGMLLLVSQQDRQARIELGAGWKREKDAVAQRIMNELIIPRFKSGDFSGGIVAGVEGLDKMARDLELPTRPRPTWHYVVGAVFVGLAIFTIISLIRRGASGWAWLFWGAAFAVVGGILYHMARSRSRGGGGFSGGSFGGGFSGGGGASGSW